jgi:predicted TIM-barrel fold metal-dependent hydrolase
MGGINTGPQLAEPIVGLIMTGTLDRYPRLKVVMAESGLAWIPHVIQTLDRAYERFYRGKSDHPRMRPSEYFERQIWMTFQEDAYGIKMLPLLYEDRIMWASDYPHPASTWPNSQKIIDSQVKHLPEATRRKLLYENARQLYGL